MSKPTPKDDCELSDDDIRSQGPTLMEGTIYGEFGEVGEVFHNLVPKVNMRVPWDVFIRNASNSHNLKVWEIKRLLIDELDILYEVDRHYYLKRRAPFLFYWPHGTLQIDKLVDFTEVEVYQEAMLQVLTEAKSEIDLRSVS